MFIKINYPTKLEYLQLDKRKCPIKLHEVKVFVLDSLQIPLVVSDNLSYIISIILIV